MNRIVSVNRMIRMIHRHGGLKLGFFVKICDFI